MVRLARATLLALAVLLTQTSCGGPVSQVKTVAEILPHALPKVAKPKPKPPETVVAVSDSVIVVKRGDRTYIVPRDDDDGDGEPDEDY